LGVHKIDFGGFGDVAAAERIGDDGDVANCDEEDDADDVG